MSADSHVAVRQFPTKLSRIETIGKSCDLQLLCTEGVTSTTLCMSSTRVLMHTVILASLSFCCLEWYNVVHEAMKEDMHATQTQRFTTAEHR